MLCAETVEKNGYGIVSGVFGPSEIAQLVAKLQSSSLARTRAGIRHVLSDPSVAGLANEERLLGIARAVLGGSPFPFRATLFDKSPESNWLVVWHQDTALPMRERHDLPGWGPWSVKVGVTYAHAPADVLARVVALRVHLDDSTAENGPLRVLPGTHGLGVLSDDAIQELVGRTAAVECLVPKGGIVAMRPLIVHASSKSVGVRPRRVLHIEYTAESVLTDGVQLAIA